MKLSIAKPLLFLLPLVALFVFSPLRVLADNQSRRLDWETFKSTPSFHTFVDTIRVMRANTNSSDPNSWLYWSLMHEKHCPHIAAYFLAWHRGYLKLFEEQIRKISGDNNFYLPYWDYYTSPSLPKEFTDPTPGNPLYMQRKNTDVKLALQTRAFDDNIIDFERGTSSSFEATVEYRPHNALHNLIGGLMSTLQSPQDPIFWLHHANMDRLWKAWVKAGDSRTMPDRNSPYWQGNFEYAENVKLPRLTALDDVPAYKNETLPKKYESRAMEMPEKAEFSVAESNLLSTGSGRLSGVQNVVLSDKSIRVPLSIQQQSIQALEELSSTPDRPLDLSLVVKLKGIKANDAALQGGFYFDLYLNLPSERTTVQKTSQHFLGTLGAFEINSLIQAQKHAHQGSDEPVNNLVLQFKLDDFQKTLILNHPEATNISFIKVSSGSENKSSEIEIKEVEVFTNGLTQ